MLDHEPDTNTQPTTNAADPVDSPPPARRRRAAVRAAGPPGGTEGAPVIETVSSTPEHPTEEPTGPGFAGGEGAAAQPPDLPTASEPPPPRTAAKRARTTSPAKKAAAKKTSRTAAEPADRAGDSTAPAPRKRASKKAAATAADETPPAVAGPADPSQADQAVDVLPNAAVNSVDEPATVDVQASPAAELEPSGESIGVVDAEQAQPTTDQEVVSPRDEQPPFDDSLDGVEEGLEEATEEEATEEQAVVAGEEPARRRRRRRGGRRRRRGDDELDTEEARGPDNLELPSGDEIEPLADGLAEAAAVPAADEIAAGEESSEQDGQRRRRRRRRRRGEDAGAAPDDPTDVVVRVRESRRERSSQAVTGIEGSTRMEAKRQRRREGREAGRRRVPILSEAEFLARRESVVRKMIIRQLEDLAQIAVLEDDILVEHYVDRDSATSLIGNVYLGRVQNVLPSMEAAFIDIGRGRNAVLYAGEVDWDAFGAEGQNRKVEKVLKSGQTVLVQVSKDPVGTKGARLTNHVSIPGLCPQRPPLWHLTKAAGQRAQEAAGHLVRPGGRGQCHRADGRRGGVGGGAGSRRQPAAGTVAGHREEGCRRQRAATALRRTGPHGPDRPRLVHRGLRRADHPGQRRHERRLRLGGGVRNSCSSASQGSAEALGVRRRPLRRVPAGRADRQGFGAQGLSPVRRLIDHRSHRGHDGDRREHRQVHRSGRQPGSHGHEQQSGSGRGDRPAAQAARHRRHHRDRLHRHGAAQQP